MTTEAVVEAAVEKKPFEDDASDSNTESDSDGNLPELEEHDAAASQVSRLTRQDKPIVKL